MKKRKKKREVRTGQIGRPRMYTDDMAINICERIAQGEPLTKICRDENMPTLVTIYRWFHSNEYEAFCKLYMKAKSDAADTLADEILEIADEVPRMGEKGVDFAAVKYQQLRVDTRKWIAAKLKPRRYGERVDQYVMGADGGAVEINHTERNVLRDQIMAGDAERDAPQPPATTH